MVGAAMTAEEILDRAQRSQELAVDRALQSIRTRKRAASVFPGLMLNGALWDVLLELFIYRSSNLDAEAELVSGNATPRDLRALRRRGIICDGAKPDTLTLGDGAYEQMQAILSA